MKNIRTILGLMLGIVIMAMPLSAGVIMVSNLTSSKQPDEKMSIKTYMDKDYMRIDTKGKDADQSVIFRADSEVFWILDNKAKEYMQMTKDDLEKAQAQMEEAMKTMDEQMKSLPPEQQKMMEKMMKGKMPTTKTPEITYKKVGSGEKVSQWVCDKYEGGLGDSGAKQTDIWTTGLKQVGLTADDMQIMKTMSEFLGKYFKQLASSYMVNSDKKNIGISGFPIKTVVYLGDKENTTTELATIQHQDLSPALFSIPDGFKKKDMQQPKSEE